MKPMKMIYRTVLAVLLVPVLLMTGCTLRLEKPETDEPMSETAPSSVVTLWYRTDEGIDWSAFLPEGPITAADGTLVTLQAVAFDSREAMARAMDTQVPDLLFCDSLTAQALYLHDRLSDLSGQEGLPACACRDSLGFFGASFFPLFADVDVLVVNTDRYEELMDTPPDSRTLSDLTALAALARQCGEEQQACLFASDSVSGLFHAYITSGGGDFTGIHGQDVENPDYVELYNLLAEAAYTGGLVPAEGQALLQVRTGKAACSIISGTRAAAADLTVFPVPCADPSNPVCTGTACGLAVLAAEHVQAAACAAVAAAIVSDTGASDTVLAAGYAPLTTVSGSYPEGSLSRALLDTASRYELLIVDDSDRQEQYDAFDVSFCRAMEILNGSLTAEPKI